MLKGMHVGLGNRRIEEREETVKVTETRMRRDTKNPCTEVGSTPKHGISTLLPSNKMFKPSLPRGIGTPI